MCNTIFSEYSSFTSNTILGSVSGQQSTLVSAFLNEFGVVAVNPSPGIAQPTDEEQQEITDTILDMEVDYLPTDQKHFIQVLVMIKVLYCVLIGVPITASHINRNKFCYLRGIVICFCLVS